jgi:uncharacterized protein YjbJ (UPF0337 family)
VGKRKGGKPEEAVDKAVGRVAEATGSLTGDETLEAEGRAGQDGAEGELPRSGPAGGGMVEAGETGHVSSIHRTKDEAETSARELAKAHKPSQVLVYKKDGTVQTERTYG